jgi:riboflavin kinase/FMN adenylyltransferase
VSSTRIRQLLEEGQVDEAARLLGYRYTLRGKVVGGYREGRKMGFPTANIRIDNRQQTTDEVADCKLLPADGVYAVYVNVVDNEDENVNDNENFHQEGYFQFSTLNSQFRKGMLNIGYRPTLNNGKERSIEVHILDFEGDLYGKDITVEFAYRLREERTYANTEELTEQLMRDKKMVRELLVAEE